ncbi:MAG: HAMP domain-containing protein [Deltaproteobacteria bacterium]|nr:HAMP domain-containing protein [Deltaproteobacteria bacterium]
MRQRILITVLLGIVIMLISLGVVSIISINSTIRHSLDQYQETSRIIAYHVDQLLGAHLSRLYDVSLSGSIDLTDDNWQPEHAALVTASQYSMFTEGVFLADVQGKLIISHPEQQIPLLNVFSIPGAESVFQERKPFVSQLSPFEKSRKQVLFILVPLKDGNGQVVGIAGGVIDPTTQMFRDLIRTISSREETTIEIVDDAGKVIVSSAHRSVPTDVVAMTPLREAKWNVVVRAPQSAVLAPSQNLTTSFLLLGIIAIGGGIALAMGLSRSIVHPIHALIQATKRIMAGDLESSIAISTKDEIGTLGKHFDAMRQQLRAHHETLEGRVRERTQELEINRQRLAASLRAVIGAQEEERRRVARELHDETSQTMTALGVSLELANRSLKERTLSVSTMESLKAKVHSLVDGINRLIQDLRPPVLDDLGFESAIRWLIERHLTRKHIEAKFEMDETSRSIFEDRPHLDRTAELMFFRILQEVIINTAKHSEANRVVINIGCHGEVMRVIVTDDGTGFDAESQMQRNAERSSGFGLIGLQERTAFLGGRCSVDSMMGQGTKVLVEFPVSSLRRAYA